MALAIVLPVACGCARNRTSWDRINSNHSKGDVRMRAKSLQACLGIVIAAGLAQAQVPAEIESGLRKIGQIVDPACTAKLYRPLMPKNDVNSEATPLYPGITIARDVSFGPHPKDLVDIFTADRGGDNRTVLIYVPG